MTGSRKVDLEEARPSPGAICPKCKRLIRPAEVRRVELERSRCPACGERFVPGLLTRTIDYVESTPEEFSRFHVREGQAAGVYLTETAHPPGYKIPTHAHQMASFYLLLAGSLNEQFGRENVER